MKKTITLLVLLSFVSIYPQKDFKNNTDKVADEEIYSYYVRITNKNKLPVILSKDGSKVFLKHLDIKSKSVFKKYKIYDFLQAFPNSSDQSLKETYLIKTNDPRLIGELKRVFPKGYTFSEQIKEEPTPLTSFDDAPFIPNDYGFEILQTDLDLINAAEAWGYTKGNTNVELGIVDTEFNVTHPELQGTITSTGSNSSQRHGTSVAMNLAANTDNGQGLSSIGYDCYIEARPGLSMYNVDILHQQGIKVINGSWADSSSPYQTIQSGINDMYNNGTVLVFSAGNTNTYGVGNSRPIYPAAYDNVISVTSVHHKDFMQQAYDENGNYIGDVLRKKDTHDNTWISQRGDGSHNHTYQVDIAAPGYQVPTINFWHNGYSTANGTSHAAPIVTGTIGLMLSVNSSISPLEIESILKLTSADIYQIPENANYIDKLGAGRLDAGKAVKMAYNMAQPTGVVEVKGRDFYRDWYYQLKNAPYSIKIEDQIFRDTIQVNFTARNSIEIQNATLAPNSIGFTELSIDPTIPLPTSSKTAIKKKPIAYINTTIFDNKEFTLKYFVKDGVKENLVLTNSNDPSGNTSRGVPKIEFTLDKSTNLLEAGLFGYCNGSNARYKIHENYLEVIKRGPTTLADCGIDESTEYFNPITGNIYMQQPAKKVYYEFTEDNTGVWLWENENHKLFFESKTLNTSDELFGNSVKIYPNPTNDFINIVLKNNFYNINKVTIYDVLGTKIKTIHNETRVDISELNSGIYLVKITSENSLFTVKKIVKN